MWIFAVIFLIIFALIVAVWAKIEGRKEKDRLEKGRLSAEDFEIIEGD